jgi:transcriptional regulator with XRE-family HTH domain
MTKKGPDLRDLRLAATDERGTPLKLSQYAVAELLGCEQPRISQIESDGTKDIDTLEKLAAIYGVSRDVVIEANRRTRGI